MQLEFNWINILILFGAIHGLIFGIILWFNKNHPGSRFLSIFMLALAYNGVETFSWSSGLSNQIIFFDFFAYTMIYTVGPSLYLYIHALFRPEKPRPIRQVMLHYFLPLFQLFVCLTVIIQYYLITWSVYHDPWFVQLEYKIYNIYSEPLSFLVFTVYLFASIREFTRSKKSLLPVSYSRSAREVVYRWIRMLLLSMVVLSLAWLLTLLTPYLFNYIEDNRYFPVELGLVFFIYWIAFTGFHRIKTISIRETEIPGIEQEKMKNKLIDAMENDKLYLDPSLTLQSAASHTGLNQKIISTILNQYLGKSFNSFVNEYRVREVCRKLQDPGYRNLTLTGIAMESGFNSQATFQRVFKALTGSTPKEYQSDPEKAQFPEL